MQYKQCETKLQASLCVATYCMCCMYCMYCVLLLKFKSALYYVIHVVLHVPQAIVKFGWVQRVNYYEICLA